MPYNPDTVPQIYDISVPIFPEMPVFPGDPGVQFDNIMDIKAGSPANVKHLHLGSQTGTHFDTPHHILDNGVTTEQIPLERCYGPVVVIAFSEDVDQITAAHLTPYASELKQAERVLFKTRNSQYWQTHPTSFREDFVALSPDAAMRLVENNIQLVGIDYLSIEPFQSPDLTVHKILLNENILILESINLSAISTGWYTLSAFPLNFQDLDGAMTRAVLIQRISDS